MGPLEDPDEGARSSAPFFILGYAGLAGAVGVGLAALAAHRAASASLMTASLMLIMHAVAAVALIAIAEHFHQVRLWRPIAILMLGSVTLFSGDVAFYVLNDRHIFPMAAPIGGSLLIASWFGVAVVSIANAYWRR